MSVISETIEVGVPIRTAYNQWTQFEEFPRFMADVERVRQLDDDTLEWTAEIAGQRRTWTARITQQVPDARIAWVSTEGEKIDGTVEFTPVSPERTQVGLTTRFEPTDALAKAGDAMKVVETRVRADLERFKEFIESRGSETGAWRGSIPPQDRMTG